MPPATCAVSEMNKISDCKTSSAMIAGRAESCGFAPEPTPMEPAIATMNPAIKTAISSATPAPRRRSRDRQ